MGGRSKNRLSIPAPPAAPRPGTPASGTPGMPAATAGGLDSGVPPNAEAIGFAVGAIAVQLGGTDNGSSEAALPKPADTPLPAQASQRAGKPTGGGTEPVARSRSCGVSGRTSCLAAEQAREGTQGVARHIEPRRKYGVP